ncbi:uncharacterized protein LOC107839113 isoform X5 [Capsicum annuum]|uniref:uncharacterized protein LOC107839113 isoform X5 n=1 Tax=Capsicum annuum TaxID=4072 RepID=UPI001FB0F6A8|nr:uncharacterized protein LOC107839113 isoform X5 [Capsicum annuum]
MMSEFPASMPAVLAEASLLTGSDDHAASISPRICHLFLYFSKLIIHYYILVLQDLEYLASRMRIPQLLHTVNLH